MSMLIDAGSAEQDEIQSLSFVGLIVITMMVLLFLVMTIVAESPTRASAQNDTRLAIYQALQKEFVSDLERWNARIDEATLTVTFNAPETLFSKGDNQLKTHFGDLLADFFPRYIGVLHPVKGAIEEVRIEGHTSSDWGDEPANQAYFLNMKLSQRRTRSVLEHVYGLHNISAHRDWIRSHVAAVGLSSARPIYDSEGLEDAQRSRRVTFKIVTYSSEHSTERAGGAQ